MPTRNIELLTKVRDLVKAEPEKLDMGSWAVVPGEQDLKFKDGYAKVSCGTTACIAGWAVQLAGDKLLVGDEYAEVGERYYVDSCVARNGRVMPIDERAEKLLGLTQEEADVLFTSDDAQALPNLDALIAGEDIDY